MGFSPDSMQRWHPNTIRDVRGEGHNYLAEAQFQLGAPQPERAGGFTLPHPLLAQASTQLVSAFLSGVSG